MSYQWKADETNIAGATSSTYTLTQAEVGTVITVEGQRLSLNGPATFETHVATREQSEASVVDAEVEVDFAGVTDVDSSALALVFFWQRHARRLTLLNPPRTLLALAELYGVVELLLGPEAAAAPSLQ